jgi:hypothetical protein
MKNTLIASPGILSKYSPATRISKTPCMQKSNRMKLRENQEVPFEEKSKVNIYLSPGVKKNEVSVKHQKNFLSQFGKKKSEGTTLSPDSSKLKNEKEQKDKDSSKNINKDSLSLEQKNFIRKEESKKSVKSIFEMISCCDESENEMSKLRYAKRIKPQIQFVEDNNNSLNSIGIEKLEKLKEEAESNSKSGESLSSITEKSISNLNEDSPSKNKLIKNISKFNYKYC